MAMGLGVGSEEVSDPAEGPLGRGEEPDWVTRTGRRARRARRRIRQRVRKRRVLAVDEMGMQERLGKLEVRNKAHMGLLDILCGEVSTMRRRTDSWVSGLEDLCAEVREGLKGASATGRVAEDVSARAAELLGMVRTLTVGMNDLQLVMTEKEESVGKTMQEVTELERRVGELGGLSAQVQLVKDQQAQAEQQAQALAHASAMWAWERVSGGIARCLGELRGRQDELARYTQRGGDPMANGMTDGMADGKADGKADGMADRKVDGGPPPWGCGGG